jgi:hypothetical protein
MDIQDGIRILQESLYWIIVFSAFLGYSMIRGKQSLINLILGLYLALLISLKFPYYDVILGRTEGDGLGDSIIMIALFAAFTLGGTFLFSRLMPRDFDESAFRGFGKKILFAAMGSVLVMAYSYHVLPITDLITPGSPIQSLFGPESNFFWWLLVPLVGLFFL